MRDGFDSEPDGSPSPDGEFGGSVSPRPERHLAALAPNRLAVTVAGYRAEFLYWGFFETEWWRNYLHTHSFFEVCYAYAGRGTFRSGDDLHAVAPGDIFVVRPGDVHEIVSAADDPLGIVFWAYTLVRSPDADALWVDTDDALLEAFGAPDAAVFARRPGRVPELVRLLADEARTPTSGHTTMVRSLAAALIVETARGVVEPANLPSGIGSDAPLASHRQVTVETMTRYLRDNYHRPVTVRDVAAQVHLSARHAARLFRQLTGTSVHAYLSTLRLEVAAQRLLERDISVKEVARACGYPDVRHFTTAFRQHWGAPPASFRRHNGTTFVTARRELSSS